VGVVYFCCREKPIKSVVTRWQQKQINPNPWRWTTSSRILSLTLIQWANRYQINSEQPNYVPPELTQTHPNSPELALTHPNSPELALTHPNSPELALTHRCLQAKAYVCQLEPYKNFTHSLDLHGRTTSIRAVSTNTGQFFVLYQDLASALTGEKDPKKLKAPLNNAREKIQTSKSEATSLLMKPKEGMLTLGRALLNLEVCMQFYLCNL